LDSPFDQRDIEEVPLHSAPLALVLTQIRHPSLVVLSGEAGEETAVRFARALADEYPILDHVRETELTITPNGVTESPGHNVIWRLRSTDGWRVSFSTQFVALDTRDYRGRTDFCDRFDRLVSVYAEILRPPYVERLGLRYFNRIDDASLLRRLPDLVRPEVLGPSAVRCPAGTTLQHALTQVLYQSETGAALKAQWGNLPPGAVIDPAVETSSKASWILDIDSFSTSQTTFEREVLVTAIRGLADQAYRHFRWAVTPAYLDEFRELR